MPYIDLHDKPFDDETLAKLSIFEDYAQAWVPTFVMMGESVICIFDFFAGTGYDKNGVPGSPIRILKVIKQFIGPVFQRKVKIQVYFNEYKKSKFELLTQACDEYLLKNPDVKRAIEITITNLDFDKCFNEQIQVIKKYPSLVYLDQNGIKFLSDKYFYALEKTTKTDFLYFVSSSYFWRFGDQEEFKTHLKLDLEEAKKDPYNFIHRNLIKQLLSKLPTNSKLKLYPFSIKKGPNIHGIIFGAKHPRAVEKFLNIAWGKNPINGDANFDIDKDKVKNQMTLFGDKKLTKIESFQLNIEGKIMKEQSVDNVTIYNFTLNEGHPPSHANKYLKLLKKQKKVDYKGISPKIKYLGYNKEEEIINIKWN
jgi:three-Cys-motif partner protein